MSTHKHLTMPWEAKGDAVFAGKDCIAICDTDNADKQTYEAKAKLMAAAPDLLAACRAAIEAFDMIPDGRSKRACAALCAAIARATA